jgi:hypothetical protein
VFDGVTPIVVILNKVSGEAAENTKLGDMGQITIIVADKNPLEAKTQHIDSAVCGDCKFSAANSGACYVDVITQGVVGVWRAYQNNRYVPFNHGRMSAIAGRKIRFGAYGDPAAVPFEVWQPFLEQLRHPGGGLTAYTHAWRTCDERFKLFCMASVDSPEEAQQARAAGWRTYRTRMGTEPLMDGEMVCPASNEFAETHNGRKTTCSECLLCDGTGGKNHQINPVIMAHGASYKVERYYKLRIIGKGA